MNKVYFTEVYITKSSLIFNLLSYQEINILVGLTVYNLVHFNSKQITDALSLS